MGNTLDTPIVEKHGMSDVCCADGVVGISSMQGWRLEMEDSHVFINGGEYTVVGVADGHAGVHCANYINCNFGRIFEVELAKFSDRTPESFSSVLKATFFALDEAFRQDEMQRKEADVIKNECGSGSTLLVCAITKSHYIIANTGDSRGIVVDKMTKSVKFYTEDHKPKNPAEQKRIEGAGGFVQWSRVNGDLAVSRAIGDFGFKNRPDLPANEQKVSCEPDVSIVEKDGNSILVLACDGVWDVMSNEDVAQFVSSDPVCEQTVGEQTVGEQTVGEQTVGEQTVGEQTVGEQTVGESSINEQQSIDKPPLLIEQLDDILCQSVNDITINVSIAETMCKSLIDHALKIGSKDNLSAAIYVC